MSGISKPANWSNAKLGDLAELINGRAFKPSDWSDRGLPIVRIQNLRGKAAGYNYFDGPIEVRHIISGGDLLFAWSGTPGTSFGAHIWDGGEAALNQHIFRVDFDRTLLHPEFLKLVLNNQLPELIKKAKGGAGLKHLNKSTVEDIPVPLPPKAEQDRIITKYRATAGRVINALAQINQLSRDALNLRNALLANVVSSAEEHVGGGRGHNAQIEEVGEIVLGRQRAPQHHTGPKMRPYLRVANVLDGRIDVSDVMRMNFSDAEYERYRLRAGDILLNEGQSIDLVGRASLFNNELSNVCFTNTLLRYRTGAELLPEYAVLVFRHYQRNGTFSAVAKITTNLAHLGAKRFGALQIPVPNLPEQQALAISYENDEATLAHVEVELRNLRSQGNVLLEAINSAAVSGRLVSQSKNETMPSWRARDQRRRSQRSVPTHFSILVKDSVMKKRVPVIEALRKARSDLSSQKLFQNAGYPEDASISEVEQFFLELRRGIVDGRVTRIKIRGEDFFRIGHQHEN